MVTLTPTHETGRRDRAAAGSARKEENQIDREPTEALPRRTSPIRSYGGPCATPPAFLVHPASSGQTGEVKSLFDEWLLFQDLARDLVKREFGRVRADLRLLGGRQLRGGFSKWKYQRHSRASVSGDQSQRPIRSPMGEHPDRRGAERPGGHRPRLEPQHRGFGVAAAPEPAGRVPGRPGPGRLPSSPRTTRTETARPTWGVLGGSDVLILGTSRICTRDRAGSVHRGDNIHRGDGVFDEGLRGAVK